MCWVSACSGSRASRNRSSRGARRAMTLGLAVIAPYGDGLITSAGFLRDFAGTIEECGVDSVWTVEHVIVADAYDPKYPYSSDGRMPTMSGVVPMPDPLELLTFFAALTTRLRFGTAVVIAPLHSPVVLAKRAATLDRLSDGRFVLGLGIGWQREEYDAVGASFSRRGGAPRGVDRRDAGALGRLARDVRGRVHVVPRGALGAAPDQRLSADRARREHRRGGLACGARGRRLVPVRDQRRGVRPAGRPVPLGGRRCRA